MPSLPIFLKTDYFLSAADCNAENEMPLSSLVRHIIESATEHANRLNVGYTRLSETGIAWVLSRLAIEIRRMPRVNERFSLETRVTAVERHSTDRLFELTDAEGRAVAAARTVWVALDIRERKLADLSLLSELRDISAPWSPACAPPKRLRAVKEPHTSREVEIWYSDLDINRHLTTTRYIDMSMSAFPLEWHDANRVTRLDAMFMKETLPGSTVTLATTQTAPGQVQVDISQGGTPHFVALLTFAPRTEQGSDGAVGNVGSM